MKSPKKIIVLSLLVSVCLTGCFSSINKTPLYTLTPPTPPSPEKTPSSIPEPSLAPLATTQIPVISQDQPTITPTQTITTSWPTIEQRCPDSRQVSLPELDLSSLDRLILINPIDENLYSISNVQIQPVQMPIIPVNARTWPRVFISPDEQWFLFHSEAYPNTDPGEPENVYDYWISSMDGSEQWLIAAEIYTGSYPVWVSSERVEFFYRYDINRCPQWLLAINPFTSETYPLPELPSLLSSYCLYPGWMISPDRTRIAYPLSGNPWSSTWELLDITQNKLIDVFPWLNDFVLEHESAFNMMWTEDGFTFILLRPYGVDIILNLPEIDAIESTTLLESYSLPGETVNYDISWWSEDGRFVGLDIVDRSIDRRVYYDNNIQVPSNFYIFDLQTRHLIDYCIDRGVIGNLRGYVTLSGVTTNGRFLAWSILHPSRAPGNYLGTVILDMETGYQAIIELPDYEFQGWGLVLGSQQP